MQPEEINGLVGRNIASLRANTNMSQAELAKRLAKTLGKTRIDPTTITRLEQGKRPTTVAELVALGQIFRVHVSQLLDQPADSPEAIAKIVAALDKYQTARNRAVDAIGDWIFDRKDVLDANVAADLLDSRRRAQVDQAAEDALETLANEAVGLATNYEVTNYEEFL